MAHEHPVLDTDRKFVIDPYSRVITNATETKLHLVQYDHNSERLTFEIPRYVEEHDMSLCNRVEVHYLNTGPSGRNSDVYIVEDMAVSDEDDSKVEFSWLVSQNATRMAGSLNFVVKFKCMEEDIITYSWSTTTFAGIKVGDGLDNTESVAEQYSDTLEYWLRTIVDTKIDSVTDITVLRDTAINEINAAAEAIDAEGAVQIVKDEAEVQVSSVVAEAKASTIEDIKNALDVAAEQINGIVTIDSISWVERGETPDDGYYSSNPPPEWVATVSIPGDVVTSDCSVLFTPYGEDSLDYATRYGLRLESYSEEAFTFVINVLPDIDIELSYTISGVKYSEVIE